jgi:hypothetical protein
MEVVQDMREVREAHGSPLHGLRIHAETQGQASRMNPENSDDDEMDHHFEHEKYMVFVRNCPYCEAGMIDRPFAVIEG